MQRSGENGAPHNPFSTPLRKYRMPDRPERPVPARKQAGDVPLRSRLAQLAAAPPRPAPSPKARRSSSPRLRIKAGGVSTMPRFKRTAENPVDPKPKRSHKKQRRAPAKPKAKASQGSRNSRAAAPSWSLLPTSAAQRGDIATLDALSQVANDTSALPPAPLHIKKEVGEEGDLPPADLHGNGTVGGRPIRNRISHIWIAQFVAQQQRGPRPPPGGDAHGAAQQQQQMQILQQQEQQMQQQMVLMQQKQQQMQQQHQQQRQSMIEQQRQQTMEMQHLPAQRGGAAGGPAPPGARPALPETDEMPAGFDQSAQVKSHPSPTMPPGGEAAAAAAASMLAAATGYGRDETSVAAGLGQTVATRMAEMTPVAQPIDLAAAQHLSEQMQAHSQDPTLSVTTLGPAAQARAIAASNQAAAQAHAVASARRQQEAMAARRAGQSGQSGQAESSDSAVRFLQPPGDSAPASTRSQPPGNSPARVGSSSGRNRPARQSPPTAFRRPEPAPQVFRALARTPILQQPFTLGGRIGGPSLPMTPKELALAAAAHRCAHSMGELPSFESLPLQNPYTDGLEEAVVKKPRQVALKMLKAVDTAQREAQVQGKMTKVYDFTEVQSSA